MPKEYQPNLEDQIDWKIIDQLHVATTTFSSTSLELKKLFFVLLGISMPALIKLAGDRLDISLFFVIYLLTITFWYLDSFTYYYQEKLRSKMDKHFSLIKERNNENRLISNTEKPLEEFTIEKNRIEKTRLIRSVFNMSVRLYPILIVLTSVALILFLNGII